SVGEAGFRHLGIIFYPFRYVMKVVSRFRRLFYGAPNGIGDFNERRVKRFPLDSGVTIGKILPAFPIVVRASELLEYYLNNVVGNRQQLLQKVGRIRNATLICIIGVVVFICTFSIRCWAQIRHERDGGNAQLFMASFVYLTGRANNSAVVNAGRTRRNEKERDEGKSNLAS
ncbi:hypothetical protein CPB85DRAFT_1278850, partial [Mucidula mucida]